MIKTALLFILLLFTFCGFSQQYAYSFEGQLSEDQKRSLVKNCEGLKNVDWVKLKYKEDSSKGELIIQCKEIEIRSEFEEGFSPINVKREFIGLGLEPKEFRKLND